MCFYETEPKLFPILLVLYVKIQHDCWNNSQIFRDRRLQVATFWNASLSSNYCTSNLTCLHWIWWHCKRIKCRVCRFFHPNNLSHALKRVSSITFRNEGKKSRSLCIPIQTVYNDSFFCLEET